MKRLEKIIEFYIRRNDLRNKYPVGLSFYVGVGGVIFGMWLISFSFKVYITTQNIELMKLSMMYLKYTKLAIIILLFLDGTMMYLRIKDIEQLKREIFG